MGRGRPGYLDASASLWYANVGHGRREIADAVARADDRPGGLQRFGDIANEPALELARRLADLAPMPDAKVFFTTGGGEAVDTAAKLARSYWSALGLPQRVHVIGRMAGYHGTNGFGTSIGGIEANRAGFGPLVPHTSYVPFDSFEALEAEILRLGSENVAAFFMEPVMGAGGVTCRPRATSRASPTSASATASCSSATRDLRLRPARHLVRHRALRRRAGHITFAKGVTSGYLPLGGVVVLACGRALLDRRRRAFRHGATYSAHPTCCAAGIANIDILEREGLIARGAELEGALDAVLAPLADHPLVSEVRAGIGLMGAIEIDPPGSRRRWPWPPASAASCLARS